MVAVGASVPDESGPAPVPDTVPVADHCHALVAADADPGCHFAPARVADTCPHGLAVRGAVLITVDQRHPDYVTVHLSAVEPIVNDLERLREENVALRRALLRLRATKDTAVTMLELGHRPQDVIRYLEDGVNAAAREVPSREAV
ncbi:hypothetical protein AB0K34_13570 [Actinomadura sp. NPDC049382]|uniref:hypothetical protein n=1 Tax=Actinomadura sp. NPDC049382 TaxID=3158220 RepID=UPI00341F2F15